MSFSNIWRRISSFRLTRALSPTPRWILTGKLPSLVCAQLLAHLIWFDSKSNLKNLLTWFLELEFSELLPSELMLRKLMSVTDLTICLDQCNAQGKIPIYQASFQHPLPFLEVLLKGSIRIDWQSFRVELNWLAKNILTWFLKFGFGRSRSLFCIGALFQCEYVPAIRTWRPVRLTRCTWIFCSPNWISLYRTSRSRCSFGYAN